MQSLYENPITLHYSLIQIHIQWIVVLLVDVYKCNKANPSISYPKCTQLRFSIFHPACPHKRTILAPSISSTWRASWLLHHLQVLFFTILIRCNIWTRDDSVAVLCHFLHPDQQTFCISKSSIIFVSFNVFPFGFNEMGTISKHTLHGFKIMSSWVINSLFSFLSSSFICCFSLLRTPLFDLIMSESSLAITISS